VEFDIKQFLIKALEKWYIIISVIALCVVSSIVITMLIPPVYSSTAKLYVINNPSEGTEYTQSSLVTAKEDLAKNYIELMTSDDVLNRVSDTLYSSYGLVYSPSLIMEIMETEVISGTGTFTVKISNKSNDVASKIVNVIAEESVVYITDIENRDECVLIIRAGTVSNTPDSPKLIYNVAVAIVLGIALSSGIIFILIITNTKIKNEYDLKKKYGVPVIGRIPQWNSEYLKKYSYKN